MMENVQVFPRDVVLESMSPERPRHLLWLEEAYEIRQFLVQSLISFRLYRKVIPVTNCHAEFVKLFS
jgi:hypothetical protein